MSALTRSFGTIVSINAHLLGAVLYGWLAYVLWPTDIIWWGFGFISMICGFGSGLALIEALKKMTALYVRDRALASYRAQAKSQTNAELASNDALRKAGVIDG